MKRKYGNRASGVLSVLVSAPPQVEKQKKRGKPDGKTHKLRVSAAPEFSFSRFFMFTSSYFFIDEVNFFSRL